VSIETKSVIMERKCDVCGRVFQWDDLKLGKDVTSQLSQWFAIARERYTEKHEAVRTLVHVCSADCGWEMMTRADSPVSIPGAVN
jgi:hypothetical protein